MRQINCYIPIKLCITGRLSDAQLEQLGQTLIRAITARMEQARHALGVTGYAPVHETVASTREAFDQARLSNGRYGLPSYDVSGKTVRVPVWDPLEEDWQNESDEAERLSKEGASPSEKAFHQRLSLLLNELRPKVFNDEDQLLKFIQSCHQAAATESETMKAAAGRLTTQELLDDYGEAFPNSWADKVYQDFHSDADLDALQKTYQSRKKDALSTAASIAAELWARGLPLSIDQARNLKEDDMVGLVLGYWRLKETSSEVTNNYARAMFWWLQAGEHYSFVKNYESNVVYSRELLRRGELVGNQALYRALTKSFKDFRRSLQNYERGAIEVLTAAGYEWMDITAAGNKRGRGYIYPTEGIDAFWKQIRDVDRQIASTGFNDCLSRAFTWAFEREFLEDAGLEVWESIKANGWKMLAIAVGILGAQFVPGLNLAVNTVLLIEFGLDALSTLEDLVGTLKDAGSAKSVLEMEHASARLAQTLVGTGAKILLWAIAWGAGKLAHKAVKYRQGQKFIDKHGDTPEVRRALADAKGDVAKAERGLATERERLAAEQRQKAAAAAKSAEPPKPAEPVSPPAGTKPPEPAPPPPKPPVKPSEPAPAEPAGKAPEPGTTASKGTTAKPSRTLAEIERDLRNQGLTAADIRSFGGGKRLSATVAERVARLMEHFTPADMKKLGEFLSERKIALNEDLVGAFIQKVPRGKMGEYVRHLEIAEAHKQATKSPGWSAEKRTLEETTTVHPGKPPRTREIVETPGSEVLRANLIKRFKEEPPPGYHAHHIIPEKQFGEGLNWMRDRLKTAGSNINEADNGVFLAARGGTGPKLGPTPNPELTRLHNSYIHAGPSKEYAYTLTRRLGNLHGNQFLKELRNIAEEMRKGEFKIDEIPYGWKGKWKPGMTAPIEPGFQPGLIEE